MPLYDPRRYMDDEQKELYLTKEEVSKRLKLNESTLRNMRYYKRGPKYLKILGIVFYPKIEVEEYERTRTKKKSIPSGPIIRTEI